MEHLNEVKMDTKKTMSYRCEKDGKTTEVRTRQIENGYIVCIYKNWYEGEGDKKEYKYEEKEYYYKDNPLEDKKEKSSETDVLKGLKSFMSKIDPLINI